MQIGKQETTLKTSANKTATVHLRFTLDVFPHNPTRNGQIFDIPAETLQQQALIFSSIDRFILDLIALYYGKLLAVIDFNC